MSETGTREPQYNVVLDVRDQEGIACLGLMTNQAWFADPKRLTFTFARYKFVAKMLAGRRNVLEVGCADAFASRIVLQDVGKLTVLDFDPIFIADVQSRNSERWPLDAHVHDMLTSPFPGRFDAAYAMDVLEHIEASKEDQFLANICASLDANAAAVFGMPSLESQVHASPPSRAGHVNCKSGSALRKTLERHFHNVFMFSMNDEVVHTGYFPMAQYVIGLCAGPKPVV